MTDDWWLTLIVGFLMISGGYSATTCTAGCNKIKIIVACVDVVQNSTINPVNLKYIAPNCMLHRLTMAFKISQDLHHLFVVGVSPTEIKLLIQPWVKPYLGNTVVALGGCRVRIHLLGTDTSRQFHCHIKTLHFAAISLTQKIFCCHQHTQQYATLLL
jgi:hypothetical protein